MLIFPSIINGSRENLFLYAGFVELLDLADFFPSTIIFTATTELNTNKQKINSFVW